MMNKRILLLSVLCAVFSAMAQEKVYEVSGGFSVSYNNKESFAIPNQINDDLMILLSEEQLLTAVLLDTTYTKKSKINTKRVSSFYTNLLGYTVNENKYSLFFTDDRNKKIGFQVFDFNNRTSSFKVIDFKLKKEKFIESINYKNQFYLLSVSKNSPDMNIYTFDENFTATKHIVSLKHLEYKNPSTNYKTSLLKLFNNNPAIKIEANNPNAIETTSKKIKIYQKDNQIIIAFDHRNIATQIQYLDLNTFELTYKNINKTPGYKKSNSYIFDNKLFQIASSNQKMKFSVLDLQTDKLIKEYKITKEDTIQFKNSPIIQEGGGMFPSFSGNRVREMEKTSKYLRKISAANLGISVYKVANEYNLVLGGTKEIITNNGYTVVPSFDGGFGVGSGFGNTTRVSVSFNPTFYGYSDYTNTKSTYINCLFDENFDPLKGDIPINSFDIINNFEDTLKKPLAVSIFKHQEALHYAYFDKNDKMFKLYKFQE